MAWCCTMPYIRSTEINCPISLMNSDFKILIALLYKAFEWPGIYLLTASCLMILLWGLVRLAQVARKESGKEEQHPLLFLFALAVLCFVYYYYFTSRPQMISSFLIVWFFIHLREFQLLPVRRTILFKK